jgi:hypothetical protein
MQEFLIVNLMYFSTLVLDFTLSHMCCCKRLRLNVSRVGLRFQEVARAGVLCEAPEGTIGGRSLRAKRNIRVTG